MTLPLLYKWQNLVLMKTQNIFLICSLSCVTYVLDDSIKSPTLTLKADHSTLLFLPRFFTNFLLWVNPYMITAIYLHDPPPFNGQFFMSPPFSESQKALTLLLFPPPPPPPSAHFWQVPYFEPTGSCFPSLIYSMIVRVCSVLSVHKYSNNFSSPCFNMPSKLFRAN